LFWPTSRFRSHIFVFFFLFFFFSRGAWEMKKAEEVNASGSSCVSEVDALFEQAFDAYNRGDFRGALQLLSKCFKLFEQEGRMDGAIKALARSSFCQNRLANFQEALKLAKKADALAVQHFGERSEHRLNALYQLTMCMLLLKDLKRAKEYALLMGEIARSLGDDVFLARSLQQLATICKDEGDYESALKHCEQALPLATTEADRFVVLNSMQLCFDNLKVCFGFFFLFLSENFFSNRTSLLYCKLKEFDRARDLAQRAYSIWLKCFGPDHPKTKLAFEHLKTISKLERDNSKFAHVVSDSRMCAKCNKVLVSCLFRSFSQFKPGWQI
jgi:tetratricopeptide (TPR) repeat protein